jgi:hypothetical protein
MWPDLVVEVHSRPTVTQALRTHMLRYGCSTAIATRCCRVNSFNKALCRGLSSAGFRPRTLLQGERAESRIATMDERCTQCPRHVHSTRGICDSSGAALLCYRNVRGARRKPSCLQAVRIVFARAQAVAAGSRARTVRVLVLHRNLDHTSLPPLLGHSLRQRKCLSQQRVSISSCTDTCRSLVRP